MNVQCDSVDRHVKFSTIKYVKQLDEEDEEEDVTETDSVIFSLDLSNVVNVFHDHQLLLDTCVGESVFRTRTLFYDIACTHTPLVVNGVNSKGKPMVIRECGNTDFGVVYYDPSCIANILSFANMVNNCYSVSYSSKHDFYSLQVSKGGCCYYFNRDKQFNIYICDLNSMVSKPKLMLVTTVNDKMKKYTVRQVKQAELAREYQRKLGYASPGQLVKLIGQGKLVKSDITAQDVVRALDIWGPDLGSLKGKTPSHQAQIEEEQPLLDIIQDRNQIMYIDLMFVNGNPFLIAVVKPLEYVMVNKLAKRDNLTLWTSLESDIRHITKYGFSIDLVRVDGEGAINSIWFETKLASIGTALDTSGAGEAVTVVERKIRQVKEKVRAVVNTLPYNLTEKLEGWLIRYAVNRIVLVPTRNTVEYASPREKLYGRNINVDKELKHGFGDYVQVHSDNIDNSNKSRTSGAIALMSAGNLEGSWYYMLLSNEQIVKRTKATPLPVPDEVIMYINKLSEKRKLNKINNTNQPVFEQNRRLIPDDGLDYDDDLMHRYNKRAVSNNVNEYSDEMYDDLYNNELHIEPVINELPVIDEPTDVEVTDDIDEVIDDIDEINNFDDVQLETDDVNIEYVEYDDTMIEYDTPEVESTYIEDDVLTPYVPDNVTDDTYTVDDVLTDELPEIEQPALRRSARNHQPGRWVTRRGNNNIGCCITDMSHNYDISYNFNMTIEDGISKLGDIAVDSIRKEMKQMCDKDVWEGVLINSLSPLQRNNIITSSMFLKDKYTAEGKFDKLKSRLVAGGHLQDREIYDNGSSPTVSTTSVFIIASIAAKENRSLATTDFPGAFLNSDMPLEGSHTVFMRLNKYLTDVLISIDKSYMRYVNDKGTCIVKLKKALYGCVESAKLWYDKISHDLSVLGYNANAYDMCVFNRTEHNNKQTTLVIHVDDMMISCCDDEHIDMVIDEIEKLYPGLTKHRGKVLNYIGMTFNFETAGQVRITMEGFIKELLEDCKEILGVSPTPAKTDLFLVKPDNIDPLLTTYAREYFHSITAKLLYLSKRSRPDILTPVAFLTKRVTKPQGEDMKKLERTIQYIRGSKDLGLTLKIDEPITVTSYIDASYGVHQDMKSHTGSVITLGKGAIYGKSSTQKLTTKSSTEAELVGLSDSANQVLWTRLFLIDQGYQDRSAIIFQDNKSTIQLINNGRSNSERTRHIDIRYFFLHDRIKEKDITIIYKPTTDMLADMLTKPLQGEQFRAQRNQLLNTT